MRTNKFLASTFVAIFVLLAVAYLVSRPASLFTESLYLLPMLLTAAAGFFVAKTYGFSSHNGKAFFLIALGFSFFAAGELIWYVLKNFMHIDPFPSMADVFFVLAYPLFFAGILKGTKLVKVKWSGVKKGEILTGAIATAILTAMVSYWGIFKAYDFETGFIDNAVAMSYGIADLLLIGSLIFSLIAARAFRGGRFGALWMILTIGFSLMLVADILFAAYRSFYSDNLKPYMYIDLVWIASYLLIAYGLFDNASAIRSIHKKEN